MEQDKAVTHCPTEKIALVVDDGPVERLAGQAMLEKLGFAVTTVASGEDALDLLDDHAVDLVLCDISMSGMNGLALLDAARRWPQPPLFIMSTSHDDAEHAIASMRKGASAYLIKPLRFDALRAAVHDAMAGRSTQRAVLDSSKSRAPHDALTGLINKTGFAQLLTERLQETSPDASCGALLLIKIVGLNHINHSYGRTEGNKVLQFTAQRLSSLVRANDLLGRVGGDQFAIHFHDLDHGQIHDRTVDLVESIEATRMPLAGEASTLTVVAGGACAYGAMEMEDLHNRADFALHLARDRSRTRIHVYSEADEVHKRALSHQLNTVALVRTILRTSPRLTMHYQPIADLRSGKVLHYEALLRLCDDNGRPCNTGELVKTCEVFGLMSQLDRAVIRTTLSDVAGLPANAGIAINLSGKSIGDPDLLRFIQAEIARLTIDPGRIVFELTETAAFCNLDEVRHFVRSIKDLGCRFALDDFGVGFSSFYYIKELDFDYLKLDGSFVAKLPHSPNDQAFVRAIVEISRVFGLTVIAEWVEDGETAEMLQTFGVSLGQGYYFGRPAPLATAASAG